MNIFVKNIIIYALSAKSVTKNSNTFNYKVGVAVAVVKGSGWHCIYMCCGMESANGNNENELPTLLTQ